MAVLAAYVYKQVLAEDVLTRSQRRALNGFTEQEQAHVVALRRAVATAGGTGVGTPSSVDVADGTSRTVGCAGGSVSCRAGRMRSTCW